MLSLPAIYQKFPDTKACLHYIYEQKYKDYTCPKCKRIGQFHWNKHLKAFTCNCGQTHLYPRKDTIFDRTGADLHAWFLALYLLANGPANSKDLERMTGVSQGTARMTLQYRILRLMRLNLRNEKSLRHWKNDLKKYYHHVSDEEEQLYLASFQWRFEQKGDRFLTLLDLAIHTKLP